MLSLLDLNLLADALKYFRVFLKKRSTLLVIFFIGNSCLKRQALLSLRMRDAINMPQVIFLQKKV